MTRIPMYDPVTKLPMVKRELDGSLGAPLVCVPGIPCCEEGGGGGDCDCNADGPRANFSWNQASPQFCAFNLFDETTTGPCGPIVAWRWVINGVVVGTTKNVFGVFFGTDENAGPWDVTLTVTDANGCTDTVVGSIYCHLECITCRGEVLPEVAYVTLSSWWRQVGTTPDYVPSIDFNQRHELRLGMAYPELMQQLSDRRCDYNLIAPYRNTPICAGSKFRIRLRRNSFTGTMEVRVWFGWITGGGLQPSGLVYNGFFPGQPCRGTFTLPFPQGNTSIGCVAPTYPGTNPPPPAPAIVEIP